MPPTAVLGFAAVAFALISVPGPDWAYVLAAGLRDGIVLPAVAGVLTGYVIVTAVVAAGVGPLVAGAPVVLTVLTFAGACYLGRLGVRMLRSSAAVSAGELDARAGTSRAYVARGIGVSTLNPKGLLTFLSILPQFTRRADGWPVPLQLATLGGVFVVIAGGVYLTLGFASERVLASRPSVARTTTRVAGVAMIVMSVALVVERGVAVLG